MRTDEMDLVYPIGGDARDNNFEELRYSLRSVAENLPHRKVWLIGQTPPWARNLTAVPLTPKADKLENIRQSMTVACELEGITNPFVFVNDDHFVMQRLDDLPIYHNGNALAHLAWLESIGKTVEDEWFAGVRQAVCEVIFDHMMPLSTPLYETHQPLPFLKSLKWYMTEGAALGAYYAVVGAGGEGVEGPDAKINLRDKAAYPDRVFLSSSPRTWRKSLGEYVRSRFPNPGPYETENPR